MGAFDLSGPDYEDGSLWKGAGLASEEICPCCGYHFGYDDGEQGVNFKAWREAWIARGMPWGSFGQPPTNWNPHKKLENIGVFL